MISKSCCISYFTGIRSLALREKIKETTTVKRIKILEDKKIIEKNKAAELLEAFDVGKYFKIKSSIEYIHLVKKLTMKLDTQNLGKIRKDLLKKTL